MVTHSMGVFDFDVNKVSPVVVLPPKNTKRFEKGIERIEYDLFIRKQLALLRMQYPFLPDIQLKVKAKKTWNLRHPHAQVLKRTPKKTVLKKTSKKEKVSKTVRWSDEIQVQFRQSTSKEDPQEQRHEQPQEHPQEEPHEELNEQPQEERHEQPQEERHEEREDQENQDSNPVVCKTSFISDILVEEQIEEDRQIEKKKCRKLSSLTKAIPMVLRKSLFVKSSMSKAIRIPLSLQNQRSVNPPAKASVMAAPIILRPRELREPREQKVLKDTPLTSHPSTPPLVILTRKERKEHQVQGKRRPLPLPFNFKKHKHYGKK